MSADKPRDARDVAVAALGEWIGNQSIRRYMVERVTAAILADRAARSDVERPCTCGSGAHPRRCEAHPHAYKAHCQELSIESLEADVERMRGLLEEGARLVEAPTTGHLAAWARQVREALK